MTNIRRRRLRRVSRKLRFTFGPRLPNPALAFLRCLMSTASKDRDSQSSFQTTTTLLSRN